jgi:preprotein translocase subunit SecG
MFWTNFIIDVLLVVFVLICPLMCLVILMQRSKQEGLGAAFGGGFTESVWGAQTSNVLVKTTVILAAIFFLTSISLARLYTVRAHNLQKTSTLQQQLLNPSTPAAGATPVVPIAPTHAVTNATPAVNTAPAPAVPGKK